MRRRQKFVIFLLLIFALTIFAYVRREIFFQQAKKLIKQNLEKNFPCKFSIGKIKAGLFYGLILENLEISFPQGHFGLVFNAKVDQAFIDYNLWQNVFNLPLSPEEGFELTAHKRRGVQTLRLVSPDINFSYPQDPLDSKYLKGQGKVFNFALRDFVFVLEGGQISFGNTPALVKNLQGRILLSQKGLHFQDIKATFRDNLQDTLKFYGELSEDHFSLTANLEHLKIDGFDILTNLALTLNKKPGLQDRTRKVRGTFRTYGSVLNNRPFPELSSSFEIQDEKLRIFTFSLGDNYNLRGIVSLSPPFNADLSLNFYQAAPSELISQFSLPEQPDFSGLVNGLIKITGDLNRPKIEGYLEVREGHIGDLGFVTADINIKGRYPIILIVDSPIRREEDLFIMEGEIDFTNLEQQDFLDLKFKADKGMLWQGWDITRMRNNQVHMSKSIADDIKVTFDTFMDDNSKGYEGGYTSELGLEYTIFGDKLLKLRLRKEEGILGLERRIHF